VCNLVAACHLHGTGILVAAYDGYKCLYTLRTERLSVRSHGLEALGEFISGEQIAVAFSQFSIPVANSLQAQGSCDNLLIPSSLNYCTIGIAVPISIAIIIEFLFPLALARLFLLAPLHAQFAASGVQCQHV
jgi:hypothetical protein